VENFNQQPAIKEEGNERHNHAFLHPVQATQLYNHQEQEKHAAKAGVQEILPLLPHPHAA
jgi:hypothetical protein